MVEAWVRIERIGNSSLTHRIDLCHADTEELHASVQIISAHVDLHERRATPIRDSVRARLQAL